MQSSRSNAFSLVELSIVLVILGLLVGGVLSGQSLIHAAELRGVSSEYSRYIAAVNSFKDKYFAIPGDMANATAFWGVGAGNGLDTACNGHMATGTETCNGDGDGYVAYPPTKIDEIYRFWQHLANAGLIEGHYAGTWDGATIALLYATVPHSKLSNAYWTVYGSNLYEAPNNYDFSGYYGNHIDIYAMDSDGSDAMTPEDAWNIDTKLDDGNPAKGKVYGYKGDSTDKCTNLYGTASETNPAYNLSFTNKACYLSFVRAF